MDVWAPTAKDERRHRAGTDEWWGETWGFDFVDTRADLAAFVRFVVHPNRKSCWFWAGAIHRDQPVILCRDLSVPMPPQPAVLEIRSSALWSHAICETPFEHWTVAMEAYAVSLEDPADAYRGELGDRVGLAFDLEWEGTERTASTDNTAAGYTCETSVTGDLQLDEVTIAVTAAGTRDHWWGVLEPDWFVEQMGQVNEGDRWIGWMLDEIPSHRELGRSLRDGSWS